MFPSSKNRNKNSRSLRFESLENRSLMAANILHNVDNPWDVNADGKVSPADALHVINYINARGPDGSGEGESSTYYLDVNQDAMVSPLDALMVINQLNLAYPPATSAAPVATGPLPTLPLMAAANAPGEVDISTDADSDVITADEVTKLLERASRATVSQDAIIAIVDRSGRILGVRVEAAVEAMYAGRPNDLAFAIDGAVAKARTAAFFANDAAPLTSRTIRNISQSTISQREVQANPNIADIKSTSRGPGWVAPIGVGGHFPQEIANTPQVDLFAIEHQNRDSAIHPGFDGIKGTADDEALTARFDVDLSFVPNGAKNFMTTFPESYGYQSGLMKNAQSRGFATLPGGIPLEKGFKVVGGVGVFFPGPKGTADFEQGFVHQIDRGALGVQSETERLNAPKVLEAEFIAYYTAHGTTNKIDGIQLTGTIPPVPVTRFEKGAPILPRYGLPIGRIDLVGITLEIFGPNPTRANPVSGANRLIQVGIANGGGLGLNSGTDQIVSSSNAKSLKGITPPEGWLVAPHGSAVDPITAEDVKKIIQQGIAEANLTRAAIRLTLPDLRPGARTKMVFAVADSTGEVLGLYRMPDATIFSIDVAVAKARNTAYFAGASLSAADQIDFNEDGISDVPAGTAITNRTIRFLAVPRYPTGAALNEPGDFSILNDPGIHPYTAENVGPALPADFYSVSTTSVLAFDAFNASRNFRDTRDITKQNGIVFFPGSTPLYKAGTTKLIGGFGVSGDGVDQDDVVTVAGQAGYDAPAAIRADQFIVNKVRLPFQKFNRNPQG